MKKLFRFSILTVTVICVNYFSTMAQGEQKAFKEGDRILSVGINRGGILAGYTNFAPSITYDYGLKGTRGIVSVGGFFSYSQGSFASNRSGLTASYGIGQDSLYSTYKGVGGYNRHTYTAGIRLGFHYSTRKLDLYGGVSVGIQKTCTESDITQSEYFKGTFPNGKFIKTESITESTQCSNEVIFSPYIGARYYLTKKIGVYIEAAPSTVSTGLSFKL
jgi:hypothetical protein